MKVSEFANKFGVNRQTVYRWLKSGLISGLRIGKKRIEIPDSEATKVSSQYVPAIYAKPKPPTEREALRGHLIKSYIEKFGATPEWGPGEDATLDFCRLVTNGTPLDELVARIGPFVAGMAVPAPIRVWVARCLVPVEKRPEIESSVTFGDPPVTILPPGGTSGTFP